MRPNEKTRKAIWVGLGVCVGLGALLGVVWPVETQEVDLGLSGAYDGTVRITRDGSGRMVFYDNEVTTPVTLFELKVSETDHGELLGLGDDDHAQYHTTGRHDTAHSATYNDALAIGADVDGNVTLGAHVGDQDIHLDRGDAETVSGVWTFSAAPKMNAGVEFDAGNESLTYNGVSSAFVFSKTINPPNIDTGQGVTEVYPMDQAVRTTDKPAFTALAAGAGYLATSPPTNGAIVEGNVGIGITSPDGKLHVHAGSAGTVAAVTFADDLVVEGNGATGISILKPDASDARLVFGGPAGNVNTVFRQHGTTEFSISNQAVENVRFRNDWIKFNLANANLDMIVEGQTDANLLHTDASTDRVGIGTATPGSKLDVAGDVDVSAGDLKLNGAIRVENDGDAIFKDLKVNALPIFVPSATQVIDATTDTISADAGLVRLDPTADLALVSEPTIADGQTGQILMLINVDSTFYVKLYDNDFAGLSNLQLGALSRQIEENDILTLVFTGTYWVEQGFVDN